MSGQPLRLRLFCFPYAGGNGSTFQRWRTELGPDVDVQPVDPPGRPSRFREPPIDRLPPLAGRLADDLDGRLDLPYALFGHSLGALVAFEVARELRRRRRPPPAHLFVSSRTAPQASLPEPPIHTLPDGRFLAEAALRLRIPPRAAADPELMRLVLPVLRADFAVLATYRYSPEPPLPCPITAFATAAEAGAALWQLDAWRRQTSGPFALHLLPGDHLHLESDPRPLLRRLRRELEASLPPPLPRQCN